MSNVRWLHDGVGSDLAVDVAPPDSFIDKGGIWSDLNTWSTCRLIAQCMCTPSTTDTPWKRPWELMNLMVRGLWKDEPTSQSIIIKSSYQAQLSPNEIFNQNCLIPTANDVGASMPTPCVNTIWSFSHIIFRIVWLPKEHLLGMNYLSGPKEFVTSHTTVDEDKTTTTKKAIPCTIYGHLTKLSLSSSDMRETFTFFSLAHSQHTVFVQISGSACRLWHL